MPATLVSQQEAPARLIAHPGPNRFINPTFQKDCTDDVSPPAAGLQA
jgi:hypothetical protein